MGGGRVGDGSGVGVGDSCSLGAKYCKRSCEIQRYKISTKITAASKTTSLRNVRKLSLATDYFFSQATIATTSPITLKIDIRPAGMTFPVRINFGTNWAASKSEMIKAVTNPAVLLLGKIHAATSSNTPVTAPAMIDGKLPAFT